MFELIDECSGQVANHFLKRNASDEGTTAVDMKELFSRFTNDVVATVSVFFPATSMKDPNSNLK